MIDLHEGILTEFSELQARFAVWQRPLHRTHPVILRTLQRLAGCSYDRLLECVTLVDRSAFRYGDVTAYLAAMEEQRIETARLAALRSAWCPRRRTPRGHMAGVPKRCSECGRRGHNRLACLEIERAA